MRESAGSVQDLFGAFLALQEIPEPRTAAAALRKAAAQAAAAAEGPPAPPSGGTRRRRSATASPPLHLIAPILATLLPDSPPDAVEMLAACGAV